MKALIFNSGIGKRMGEFTKTYHKSMAPLYNSETIFERQIRLLQDAGITEVIITVGPFAEQFQQIASKPEYRKMKFTYVPNPVYDETNYIYSMHLAKEYLDDDVLMLHGDLVFDKDLVPTVLSHPASSLCLYNKELPQPEKDFKGRIRDGVLHEVSVNINDEDCYAFQPMYKLSKETIKAWSDRVAEFIKNGNDKVYAEEALNTLLPGIKIVGMSYNGYFLEEVDTLDDLARVLKGIKKCDFPDGPIKEKC